MYTSASASLANVDQDEEVDVSICRASSAIAFAAAGGDDSSIATAAAVAANSGNTSDAATGEAAREGVLGGEVPTLKYSENNCVAANLSIKASLSPIIAVERRETGVQG